MNVSLVSIPARYYLAASIMAILTACGVAVPQSGGGDATSGTPTATASITPVSDGDGTTASPAPSPGKAVTASAGTEVPGSGSGIIGHTIIGPICPVQRVNQPCPPRPYAATISVLGSGTQPVTQAQSDAQGRFQIDLPPGTYTLAPQSPGIYPRAAKQTVTVTAGSYISVTITYDSGIR